MGRIETYSMHLFQMLFNELKYLYKQICAEHVFNLHNNMLGSSYAIFMHGSS